MLNAQQKETATYGQDGSVMLAAGMVERAAELLADGWVKGRFYTMIERGTPTAFCILGALELALEELMPKMQYAAAARQQVHEVAVMFILDEVEGQGHAKAMSIPAWNDSGQRSQEEIDSVMAGAARRLWDLALDTSEELAELSRHVSISARAAASKNDLSSISCGFEDLAAA